MIEAITITKPMPTRIIVGKAPSTENETAELIAASCPSSPSQLAFTIHSPSSSGSKAQEKRLSDAVSMVL